VPAVKYVARGLHAKRIAAADDLAVIPGRERSERTGNPDENFEIVSGFRVWRFAPSRNDRI
jgi:hypothetical protein